MPNTELNSESSNDCMRNTLSNRIFHSIPGFSLNDLYIYFSLSQDRRSTIHFNGCAYRQEVRVRPHRSVSAHSSYITHTFYLYSNDLKHLQSIDGNVFSNCQHQNYANLNANNVISDGHNECMKKIIYFP